MSPRPQLVFWRNYYVQILAFQISFDLEENENGAFLLKVSNQLPNPKSQDVPMTDKAALSEAIYAERSDLSIRTTIKQSAEGKKLYHSATIFANVIMHAGTTVDTYLTENQDWLDIHSAKFSATARLGVIYYGYTEKVESLKSLCLPQEEAGGGSPYSIGGALFSLGLINANHREGIKKFLCHRLRSTETFIKYGACLGLGLAALATANNEIFDEIKNVLCNDSPLASEVAGISLGLLMVGTASKADEMLAYSRKGYPICQENRGLAFGIALAVYGREENADALIEKMTSDTDPIIRYGGMFSLALAYRGTSNNQAIGQLLFFAERDESNDVRMAACLALGFVLYSDPQQASHIVSRFSKSKKDPYVRYGAAMAVGISCAGTGLSEAITLLKPLTGDVVDFVRQGALITMAMVMIQTSEASDSRVGTFRQDTKKIILEDNHTDTWGAIVASGILDAGGRNVTIKLLFEDETR